MNKCFKTVAIIKVFVDCLAGVFNVLQFRNSMLLQNFHSGERAFVVDKMANSLEAADCNRIDISSRRDTGVRHEFYGGMLRINYTYERGFICSFHCVIDIAVQFKY